MWLRLAGVVEECRRQVWVDAAETNLDVTHFTNRVDLTTIS
ncbi:hypothetical protein CA54_05690 [Symmachiella macrocystis]|uniref:Uncharacterized protein n=1 Tax=Symmachiella macrocystis TaxID=2527985 RepID=A0A5C6BID7_9PLAN|nr:hypothetical protein CA54_05690 [Symmachiella macrocystis]